MTHAELADIYLASRDLRLVKGDGIAVLLPLILMDAVYQIYTKKIAPLECSHMLQSYKTKWDKSYHLFNRDFFRPFTVEQRDDLLDLMDAYEEFIEDDMLNLKAAIIGYVPEESIERADIIASLLLCNSLIQCSQAVWKKTFKNAYGKPETNPHIESVQKNAYLFMNAFRSRKYNLNVNQYSNVCDALDSMVYNTIQWAHDAGGGSGHIDTSPQKGT